MKKKRRVWKLYAYSDISLFLAAEKALGLAGGTFRDCIISASNGGISATDAVKKLIDYGTRPTLRMTAEETTSFIAQLNSGTITCISCASERDISCFQEHKPRVGGRSRTCRDCEALSERCERYAVNISDIYDLWNFQNGRCGLCSCFLKPEYGNVAGRVFEAPTSEKSAGHIDHSHRELRQGESRRHLVRGILCSDCNRGLKEHIVSNPDIWVRSAIAWLVRPTGLSWDQIGPVPDQYRESAGNGVLALRQYVVFGMTPADRQKIREVQGNRCGICSSELHEGRLEHLDHDQSAPKYPYRIENVSKQRGQIRGLLCAACNTALPRFKHNPEVIVRIPKYLLSPPAAALWPM